MAVKLPAVPETILKRRKFQAENSHLRAKEAVTYRNCKLFRCYMAVGYIARYIWLYSHEIDGHVCMAL